MIDHPAVLAIILHYGSVDDTIACVAALQASTYQPIDILIVENTATSDLKGVLPDVEKIQSGGNIGFAAGNNFGLRLALERNYPFSFLANNDLFVDPGMFAELMDLICSDLDLGLLGPATYFHDRPDEIWAIGGDVERWKIRVQGRHAPSGTSDPRCETVGYLPGSAVLIRNSLLPTTGLLPEKYFLGYEEAELAVRFTRAGSRVAVAPRAIAHHKVGMSSDRAPKYLYNDFRNRFLFAEFLHGLHLGRAISWLIVQAQHLRGPSHLHLAKRAFADHLRYRKVEADHLQQTF